MHQTRYTWSMSRDAVELLNDALKLPSTERAALIDSLIDSLDPNVDEDAETAWRSEIQTRRREIESGAVETISWETARRRLRAQHGS